MLCVSWSRTYSISDSVSGFMVYSNSYLVASRRSVESLLTFELLGGVHMSTTTNSTYKYCTVLL